MTLTLWRALSAPPVEHPLYRRVGDGHDRRSLGLWLALSLAAAIVFLCSIISMALHWAAPALPFLPLALPLLINLRAFGAALDVADAVGRERERDTWELLCLLPRGGLWSGWVLASAWINRHGTFDFITRLMQAVFGIGGVMVAAITLVAVVSFEPARYRLLTADQMPGDFMLASIALIALFYVDFIQTRVLAGAVGLAAGVSARNRDGARILAAALFVVIHLATYVTTGVVGLILVPDLFTRLAWTGLLPLVGLIAIRFALLCGTRELVLTGLWHRLSDQLGDEFARQGG